MYLKISGSPLFLPGLSSPNGGNWARENVSQRLGITFFKASTKGFAHSVPRASKSLRWLWKSPLNMETSILMHWQLGIQGQAFLTATSKQSITSIQLVATTSTSKITIVCGFHEMWGNVGWGEHFLLMLANVNVHTAVAVTVDFGFEIFCRNIHTT